MSTLRFRNITSTPDDPVEQWGVEGILAAIDRGSLPHLRRIAGAVRADPWGPIAADLDQALRLADDVGVASTLRRALAHARHDVNARAREEVRGRLARLVQDSGLSAGQFARRLGTSASRMSTYLTGAVVPSAALLVRAEDIAALLAGSRPKAGEETAERESPHEV